MTPPKYVEGLPRVSAIVESEYPFEGNARMRFESWLMENDIRIKDYMEEASSGGTYVHKALEDYLDGKPFRGKKYQKLVKSGISFIKETGIKKLYTEHYIRTKDYQGTIDLVAEYGDETWILDWKTYGLAKHKFGLPIPKYKKPYDKLKKARLQLSLYAYAMGITKIAVVELTDEGYHFHPLELVPIEEVKKILLNFKYNYVDEI